jgi:hypothetical protein
VIVVEGPGQPAAPAPAKADDKPAAAPDDLRREAMNDPTVQALLEIFPVEKTRVEEV